MDTNESSIKHLVAPLSNIVLNLRKTFDCIKGVSIKRSESLAVDIYSLLTSNLG